MGVLSAEQQRNGGIYIPRNENIFHMNFFMNITINLAKYSHLVLY